MNNSDIFTSKLAILVPVDFFSFLFLCFFVGYLQRTCKWL